MKKVWMFLLVAIIMMMLQSCSRETVERGEVGIKFFLYGQEKGVQDQMVGPGRYWLSMNEYIYRFPTFTINYVYTKDIEEGSPTNEEFTFQTVEGMDCSMDLGVSLHFQENKIIDMFRKYKKSDEEIKSVVVRMAIRDAVNSTCGKLPTEYVYGAGKAVMIDTIQAIVKRQLDPHGIIVDKISLIGSIRLPEVIRKSIDLKASATQAAMQLENEVRGAEAEAKKKEAYAKGIADSILIVATAQAKSNEMLSKSISQTLVNYKMADKWNGTVPQVTSGTPLIDLRAAAAK